MDHSAKFILNIISLVISILLIVGLIYLTKFSFTAKPTGVKDYVVTDFTKTEMDFCKITIVLAWIQIALTIIGAIWWMTNNN